MAALSSRRAFVLPCWFVVVLAACNAPKPTAELHSGPKPSGTDQPPKKARLPAWQQHEAAPMPAAFAGFPVVSLDTLVGHWVVASDIPGQRELWIIEEQGRKLTSVDARGRERVHGLTLPSPCTLALTDEGGRTHQRRFARIGERLYTHPKGAAAITAGDGAMLACVGTQTIVVPVEGACTSFGEMLGVWSEMGAPAGTCARQLPPALEGQPPAELVIGERRLRSIDASSGVWMDDVLEQALADKVADRPAGEQALAKPAPQPTPEPAATETGATETGS
jgi:hypothetical protein